MQLTQRLATANLLVGHSRIGFRAYQAQVMPRLSSRWKTRVFPQYTASAFDGKREIVSVTGRLGSFDHRSPSTFLIKPETQAGLRPPSGQEISTNCAKVHSAQSWPRIKAGTARKIDTDQRVGRTLWTASILSPFFSS